MYSIVISQSALKQLQNLQKPFVKKIGKAIEKLANDPRPIGVKKLQVQMRTCTGSEWVITVLCMLLMTV